MNLTKLMFVLFVIAAALLAVGGWADAYAAASLETNTQRALSAFGIAKAINAVISLIQGTELSFTPIGIGLTLSVGELLDPLNDMVERFSWIMLFASVSLLIQSFLIAFSSSLFVKILLATASGLLLFSFWKRSGLFSYRVVLLRLFLVALFLRFFVIGVVMLETASFDALLAPRHAEATELLEQTHRELKALETETVAAPRRQNEGLFGYIGERSEAAFDIQKQLERLEKRLDRAQDEMLSLIAVFVFQTVLVPMLFLWFLVSMLKWALRSPTDLYAVMRMESGT